MKDIIKYITNFMRETADKLDAGNSNITEQQASCELLSNL